MLRLKTLALIVSVCLLVWGTSLAGDKTGQEKASDQQQVKPASIHWMRYDEGLAKAKKEGKHIFANFTTAWCGYCKKMNATTFVDPEIVRMMNDNFIAVKIDGDSRDTLNIDGYKITERNLTRSEYRVSGYPTYWFLESDGTKLGALRGYQGKDQLGKALKMVAERQYEKPAQKKAASKGDK